jgi:glycosyltransferase involved in cell wall biosynthesis
MSEFKISVIIPVYNAEAFLENAIRSALDQPQTGEVILVEDASPDNCYEICQHLTLKNPKIKLFIHPNHTNQGAGASRNLGLQNAQFPYIAFLDADDYFLPNRFFTTEKIFLSNPSIEGVYEACGFEFYSEKALEYELIDSKLKKEEISSHLYTIQKEIKPEDFFYEFMKGGIGFFQTSGLTFKKVIIDKVGLMDTELRLHQDTEFYYRMAALCKLAGGQIKNRVTIIGRHDHNRITNRKKEDLNYQIMVWEKLLDFVIKNIDKVDSRAIKHVLYNRAIFYDSTYKLSNKYVRVCWRIINYCKLILSYPQTIKYLL